MTLKQLLAQQITESWKPHSSRLPTLKRQYFIPILLPAKVKTFVICSLDVKYFTILYESLGNMKRPDWT